MPDERDPQAPDIRPGSVAPYLSAVQAADRWPSVARSLDLRIATDEEDLCGRVAREIRRTVRQTLSRQDCFRLVLSGGRTPQKLYQRLASPPHNTGIPWPKVHMFFGDERFVPPDHPDSNYGMVRRAFLDGPTMPRTLPGDTSSAPLRRASGAETGPEAFAAVLARGTGLGVPKPCQCPHGPVSKRGHGWEASRSNNDGSSLDTLSIPSGNVHPVPTDTKSAQEAADFYERILREHFKPVRRSTARSSPPFEPFPSFDLVLLGLGEDGHVASLFPGTAALSDKKRWVCAVKSPPAPPPDRITFTVPVLNQAKRIFFLVSGSRKARILKQVLNGPPNRYPAQRIRPVSGSVVWWADRAACP